MQVNKILLPLVFCIGFGSCETLENHLNKTFIS